MIDGVDISPIATACAAALCATIAASWVLTRTGFYRFVWHRPLVEVAIFCIFLGLFGLLPAIGVGP